MAEAKTAPQSPWWGRHWSAFFMAGALLLAGAYSFWQLLPYALQDNPLGFVPLVPVLAAALVAVRARRSQEAGSGRREWTVDVAIAAPLLLGAVFVSLILPVQLAWYFWLYRLDLLVLPLLAVAFVALLWGTGTLLRVWPALLYFVLVWPFPVFLFQRLFGEPLTALATAEAAAYIRLFRLPYTQDPAAPALFLATFRGEEFRYLIAQVCSGTSALTGFLLVGSAILLLGHGSLVDKVTWLVVGALLALASNAVRLFVLFTASVFWGPDRVLGTLHPVLGLLLFILVVGTMLWLAPRLGFHPAPPASGENRHFLWEAVSLTHTWQPALAVGALALVFAVLNFQMRDLAWTTTPEGVPAVTLTSEELAPPLPTWQRQFLERLNWQDLFGPSARGRLYLYERPEGPGVVVQQVLTQDFRSLRAYSVENCDLFHGAEVRSATPVGLGWGIVGTLVNSIGPEGLPGATLYWVQPVLLNGELYHARLALLLDVDEPAPTLSRPALAAGRQRQTVLGLLTFASGRPSAWDDAQFANVDAHLYLLAREMVAAMMVPAAGRAAKACRSCR